MSVQCGRIKVASQKDLASGGKPSPGMCSTPYTYPDGATMAPIHAVMYELPLPTSSACEGHTLRRCKLFLPLGQLCQGKGQPRTHPGALDELVVKKLEAVGVHVGRADGGTEADGMWMVAICGRAPLEHELAAVRAAHGGHAPR